MTHHRMPKMRRDVVEEKWNYSEEHEPFKCSECGTEMNPAERMLGPICGKCTKKEVEKILHRK